MDRVVTSHNQPTMITAVHFSQIQVIEIPFNAIQQQDTQYAVWLVFNQPSWSVNINSTSLYMTLIQSYDLLACRAELLHTTPGLSYWG